MKKRIYILICLLMIIDAVTGYSCNSHATNIGQYYNNKNALFNKTLLEVGKLNNSSDFLGHKLLDKPPKDSNPSILNYLQQNNYDDTFSLSSFHNTNLITCISLTSSHGHILGIYKGDLKSTIANKLDHTNYILTEFNKNYISYSNAYITLYFSIGQDNRILNLTVTVYDPNEAYLDY